MKILALDLGKFNTMCCFFDTQTRQAEFLTATTDRTYLSTVFKKHKVDVVVMEACGPSGWINDLAVSYGLKTLVCSTNEDAWKWSNVKRKTDKDDALKLARMAAMNELKAVHMPSQEHREFRSLVKYRKTLDHRINKMKNTIRAWFVNHGISIDRGEKAWCTGRARINSFRKPLDQCGPDELWRAELDIELTQFDALTAQLDLVVKKLEAIGKEDPCIRRIRTIPGVGPRTAEILVACIDDPHRFKNGRQVSEYFGLVPRQYQSGETDRNGRTTKRGNPLAPTILVECAWASLRDEKDWEPSRMIEVSESFGRMPGSLKESLGEMKPKENSDQRRSRRLREAREAKETEAVRQVTVAKPTRAKSAAAAELAPDKSSATQSPKPRLARKPVSAG